MALGASSEFKYLYTLIGRVPAAKWMEELRDISVLEMAPWVLPVGWADGKGHCAVVCFLVQWSAGSRGIWCSRDRRKNPCNLLGSETEEAFFG